MSKKEDLIKKITAIEDDAALDRIIDFMAEEAAVYETAELTPEQHKYVTESIERALKESEEGKGRPFDEFFKSLD